MKKKEALFIGGILSFACILWVGMYFFRPKEQNMISISVSGEEYGTYSLDEDQIIHINDTNICEIKNGQAFMIDATCPDQYCIHQKAIDHSGGSIICLPNKIIIKGENLHNSTSDGVKIDAVT